MTVAKHIEDAFQLAFMEFPIIHEAWVKLSHQLGSKLPNSLLDSSIQEVGRLDMLLRSMENSFQTNNPMFFHCQSLFSSLWIGHVYEVFRLLSDKQRQLTPDNKELHYIARDLKLIRVTLEKHEIADDHKLQEPLQMQTNIANGGEVRFSEYSKNDPLRSHIMGFSVSERGSLMWNIIDIIKNDSYWVERRELSERILRLAQ